MPDSDLSISLLLLFIGSLIQIGIEKFHKNDHGYTLDSGKGERQITRRVQFETRYAGAPQVFTGFAMLDVTNGTGNDFRVESLATEADEFGFGIGAKTCVNSKVWSLQVPWIAVDPRLLRGIPQEDNLVLGSRVKMAVHVAGYTLNRGEGARHIDKNVMFDATFSSPPDVAVFLSGVDILLTTEPEKAANGSDDEEDVDDEEVGLPGATLDIDARIITSDENRSKHGFTLRTATWGDARVWSATSCWLAIGERRPEPVREVEEEEEDEEEEVEAEEAEEEDFLPPRAKLDVKRQLSIPLIAPAEIPVAKKAKVAEEAEPAPKAAPELTDENECKVCMDAVINTVLIPCGHLAACLDCVTLMRSKGNKECPICKQEVASVVKMFKA